MSSINSRDFDFVVMGAGPAGLAAAGHLAKGGSTVAVFDFRPRPADVFGSYPVVLNPRGLQALESLDVKVIDKVREVGTKVEEIHIVPNGQRTVAQVKTYGLGIMRDQVAYILLEHCEQCEGISIFWEHKLEELNVAEHSLRFSTSQGEVVVADVQRLVAADGNRSRVRRSCVTQVEGFSAEELPWGFQMRFMNSKPYPKQEGLRQEVHYVLGDKGYVCQQPNGVWSISLRVLPGHDGEFLTATEATEENIKQLKEYTETYAGIAAQNILTDEDYKGFYDCRSFDGLVVQLSQLNPAGWIAIIGDAAHAVQPATGEGINSGLEDAFLLGGLCAKGKTDQGEGKSQDCQDPFEEFDRQHRADSRALKELAMGQKDKVVSSSRSRATDLVVNIGLALAKKCRIVKGTVQDFMLGELAHSIGVKPYSELLAMQQRQTRALRKVGNVIGAILRLSQERPQVREELDSWQKQQLQKKELQAQEDT